MQTHELTPHSWTLIASHENPDDIDIRPVEGRFYVSLMHPSEKGAAIVATPPVAMSSGMWSRRQVSEGVAVYAKAIGGPATANVMTINV